MRSSDHLPDRERHSVLEDGLAILVGTGFVSLGVTLYGHATLLTGGSAGLALVLHYATGWRFSVVFSLVNVPFYVLAVARMGWRFTARTALAVTLVSLLASLTPLWLRIEAVDPVYASILGGCLMGTGILLLIRHRTGLGGVNILALYVQERFGLNAGRFQLMVDLAIFAGAWFVVPADRFVLSALGTLCLNGVILINHKPLRYLGFS